MPEYVYGCSKDKTHERVTVVHRFGDNPLIECTSCRAPMQRIPQAFRFGRAAITIYYDWCEENWRRLKARKNGKNAPRFSPDKINTPDATPLKPKSIRRTE
jgi:hypothetical protein